MFMRARVLEIDDRQVYLEIDSQLRFRSRYVRFPSAPIPAAEDIVEFHFTEAGTRLIVIEQVEREPLPAT